MKLWFAIDCKSMKDNIVAYSFKRQGNKAYRPLIRKGPVSSKSNLNSVKKKSLFPGEIFYLPIRKLNLSRLPGTS